MTYIDISYDGKIGVFANKCLGRAQMPYGFPTGGELLKQKLTISCNGQAP